MAQPAPAESAKISAILPARCASPAPRLRPTLVRPLVPEPAIERPCEHGAAAAPAPAPALASLAAIERDISGATALSVETRLDLARADQARREFKLPPKPTRGFESDQARARSWALAGAQACIVAMNDSARVGSLGGPLAAAQIPESDRPAMLLSSVLSKAGSSQRGMGTL